MVRTVVVGFDGTQPAVHALTWAVQEARLHRAELAVRTVLDRPLLVGDVLSEPDGPPIRSELSDRLHKAVVAVTADYPVRFETVHGGAAAKLIAACDEEALLVLGTRGHNPVTELLLGSVSRACLHHAPCPVVVVPGPVPFGKFRRVLVGVDTSLDSRHALQIAAEEARLRGDAVHAIHAVYWDHIGAELATPDTKQLVAWGKQLVADELERAGVDARPVVVAGHAADVLVRHSTHADLLVLGSRGRNPLAVLLLGSTSDHCARHAGCPVMLVRTHPRTSSDA